MSKPSKRVSIFNNVLGPVMRGPSSSHTAASYHLGRMLRDLLGVELQQAQIAFDRNGSFAATYRQQASDRAFVAGLLGWDLLDDRFYEAISLAAAAGKKIEFIVSDLPHADHPNYMEARLVSSDGKSVRASGKSIGGGSVTVCGFEGFEIGLSGASYDLLVLCRPEGASRVGDLLAKLEGGLEHHESDQGVLFVLKRTDPAPDDVLSTLKAELESGLVTHFCEVKPVFFPLKGEPIFRSAHEMVAFAAEHHLTLGSAALAYECSLLGMSDDEACAEMLRRYGVMKRAAERALSRKLASTMQLLEPTADKIFDAECNKKLPYGGPHTRAAARAMAVMHANGAMDVVCAAPTGGSAGALPGTILTLEEELRLEPRQVVMALFAAGAVGLVLDVRATFAAEVAGCQVEIGAGGAMASAACVEVAGGTAVQACDAAAISFQNTMGSVCDLVQGIVEIPCHTRNAAAAACAFVNADLILGGYVNPVDLDETVDAVFDSGKMLPSELRCTALGGLALCPSAQAMPRIR